MRLFNRSGHRVPKCFPVRVVRHIGDWSTWIGVYPHPTQLGRARYIDHERELIASYIERTPIFFGWPTIIQEKEDCLLAQGHGLLDVSILCDGVWMYPRSLAHYVRHGIQIPTAFVKHIRLAQYRPPISHFHSKEFPSDRGRYWIYWSIFHSSLFQFYSLLFLFRSLCFLPLRWLLYPFFCLIERPFSKE